MLTGCATRKPRLVVWDMGRMAKLFFTDDHLLFCETKIGEAGS